MNTPNQIDVPKSLMYYLYIIIFHFLSHLNKCLSMWSFDFDSNSHTLVFVGKLLGRNSKS